MKNLAQLLSDEQRQAIRLPIEQARTFPRHAFIDPEFYRLEVEHVLKESWMAVSFSPLVPNPGDIVPMTVLGCPIMLVRDGTGVIRAFHNVSSYDGCEITLRSQHGVETIITPYHGWEYDLKGRHLGANYWNGLQDLPADEVAALNADLVEIPVTEWLSTIFVYLGDHPEPFEKHNKAVLDHLSEIDFERIEPGLDEEQKALVHTLTIDSNWKTVYENYSPNVYHESFVHAMYRKSPHSPRVDKDGNKTYTEINDPSGYLGLCYDNSIGGSFYGESKLPAILDRVGSSNRVNTISNVFPNWVTTILGDTVRISIFLPEGVATGTQMVCTLFDKSGATDPALTSERVDSARKGIVARKEDNVICESIQRARHSPAVDSQFYSPFWDAMHYTLTNLVLDRLEAGEQRQQS